MLCTLRIMFIVLTGMLSPNTLYDGPFLMTFCQLWLSICVMLGYNGKKYGLSTSGQTSRRKLDRNSVSNLKYETDVTASYTYVIRFVQRGHKRDQCIWLVVEEQNLQGRKSSTRHVLHPTFTRMVGESLICARSECPLRILTGLGSRVFFAFPRDWAKMPNSLS
jgi:hypothetical protein